MLRTAEGRERGVAKNNRAQSGTTNHQDCSGPEAAICFYGVGGEGRGERGGQGLRRSGVRVRR